MDKPKYLSAGQAAKALGITCVQVTRLFEMGLLPPAMRVGRQRAIPVEDLPKLEEAAREAGYLTAE